MAATNRLKYPKKRRRPGSWAMYPTAYRWMRKPTPVISRTKIAESGSRSSPKSIFSPPTGMNLNSDSSAERSPRPFSLKKYVRPSTNEIPTLATPSQCPHRSARRPASSRIAALASGMATSSQRLPSHPPAAAKCTLCSTAALSVLQQVRVVDTGRPPGTEDGHDDGQAHHDLGGRHHHHEERHDLAVQRAVDPGERHERQVRGVEHELDAHEQDDGVAADEHAHGTDREQHRGQHDVVGKVHSSVPFGAASAAVSSRVGRIGEMLRSDGVPSGSRAGVATESEVANTPGPALGAGLLPGANRARMSSTWVIRSSRRFSTCARSMAPTAAVISSAEVTSNAKTYRVNSRLA